MSTEFPYKPGGISCREVVELVTEYLDGALTPEERAHLEEHIALCPPCQAYIDQIRTTAALAAKAEAALDGHPDRDTLLASFRDFQRARRTGA